MIIKQIMPKGKKVPELSLYELKGINLETAKSYLSYLPETDRTLGIEVIVQKESIDTSFFIESHRTDLDLKSVNRDDSVINVAVDYFSCQQMKSSIFPFRLLQEPIWNNIDTILKDEEQIQIQLLFLKKPQKRILDALWTQYEDYVNGVEMPTNNPIIRSIQNQILETMRKIEGGYRKHARLQETENKLNEDLFLFELRFSIASESNSRREHLLNKVKEIFQYINFINSWSITKELDKNSFSEHMRLRRFSLFKKMQYLSVSEIAGFFLTEIDKIQNQSISTNSETIEKPEPSITDNNPFSIFPYGDKREYENDFKIATQINKALRKLSLTQADEVIIQKIQQGSTVKRITFSLPEGLKLTTLKKSIADIQTELALNDISIVQGNSAGTAILTIPQEERIAVFVRDCVEDAEFKKFVKEAHLPILIGQSETGEVIFVDLINVKHLLTAGSTGSGKSVFFNSVLTILLTMVSPTVLQVIMIDPKMVELQVFERYPHVQKVYTDMDEVEDVLSYLCEKMDERYGVLKEKNYKNIQQHNRNEPVKLPYIVLVIDELADLIMTNPENEDYIVRLAQKARAAGIHLIIATQRPIKEVVTGLIKANIYSRVCFACDSGISYRVALDENPSFNLLGKGDGVYRFEGIQGLHRFQGALIAKTEEEQDKIIETLSTHWKVKTNKELIDLEASKRNKKIKELNGFKKLVLQTGETRITELQKILSVRNEKVKELMNNLIEIGWVKQHKSRSKGFELLLSDEERKKALEGIGE